MNELLLAVKNSPFLLAFLVVLGALIYAAEKLGGLNGPMSRLWAGWQNRELNRLRRDALIRAEKRRLDQEAESGRVADLARELADLRETVQWLSNERNDQRRRDRLRDRFDRDLGEYVDRLLRAARSAGVPFADPPDRPEFPDLAPLLVQPEDTAGMPDADGSRNPAPVE